jgi:diguanylate cyclase (GGDEF)-like protein
MVTTRIRHRDLERLLRRLGLTPDEPPADAASWADLLDAVSRAYGEADERLYTLERSIEVSSREMRELHDALSHRARHDTLTGLPNRLALKEILQATLDTHVGSGRRIAVLFIDLDGFKLVNDGLGHAVGDELLVRAAERIRSTIRPDDVVARLGGDEFIVLCPEVDDVALAIEIARRIGEQLDAPFPVSDVDTANVSASIGIALARDGTTADELIADADLAMYAAKGQGRGSFLLFDEAMRARLDERLATENALRRAVDQRELSLHFQPIVSLTERRMTGAEALLRWNRPGCGLQSAAAFIEVAESGRLITTLDAWVLTEACRQASSWGDERVGVSVNVSSRDVHHNRFLAVLTSALGDSGLHPGRLTLELAEAAVMTNPAATAVVLGEVNALGVRIAVDDFGTGYWSIEHLRRLPIHVLKLDRSVSANVETDSVSTSVVSALVAMGHALGLQVVAEGVERPEQAALLGALGCDAAQGHLFGRPAEGPPFWR